MKGAAALLAALLAAQAPGEKPVVTPPTIAALPPSSTTGRGASLPFVEYEAENAVTTGEQIGPDRRFTTLASEASGRRAVRLSRRGQYVAFTLARPANALVVRYAVPDSRHGGGQDSTLGVYVGGRRLGSLRTTSRYGWYYGKYPFTNRPSDGWPHHFYDETRFRLARVLPAGTTVRLMIGDEDRAPWYAVDLADFELTPPPARPPRRALNVRRFGADPTGFRLSTAAFRRAILAARLGRQAVWIPPGTFRVNGHLVVDRVTMAGAGPWFSTLTGKGVGIYGRKGPRGSRAVELRDFAIIGEVRNRDDRAPLAGVGGAMGGRSRLANLWIQHVKVGLWFDGPMDGIIVQRLRVTDTAADGLNFHRNVSNAVVEDSFFRNTGDDGLAAWSGKGTDHDVVFRHNTVILPILANGIAVYGGRDIQVLSNLVADTLTQGGGIHLGNRFGAVPLSGGVTIAGNFLVRSGSYDPNWHFGVGALWFFALDAPMTARIEVRDLDLVDSTDEAIQFMGLRIDSVALKDVRIRGASHAFRIQSLGSAILSTVSAGGLRGDAILLCQPPFELHSDTSNTGLNSVTRSSC